MGRHFYASESTARRLPAICPAPQQQDELFAAISGLGMLKMPCRVQLSFRLRVPCERLRGKMGSTDAAKRLEDSWGTTGGESGPMELLHASNEEASITFHKVKGHSDHPETTAAMNWRGNKFWNIFA
jgi:hypothetical protein